MQIVERTNLCLEQIFKWSTVMIHLATLKRTEISSGKSGSGEWSIYFEIPEFNYVGLILILNGSRGLPVETNHSQRATVGPKFPDYN